MSDPYFLVSANGQFRFYLQGDGNLVLRKWSTKEAVWASGTHGKAGTRFIFQRDGNLVLYTSSNAPVWASSTVGSGVTLLKLHDNGVLALYRGSSVIWSVPTDVVDNCPNDPNKTEPGQCGCGVPEGTCDGGGGGGGGITHIATTKVYDSNGQNMTIARPAGSQAGDLLILALHRTDDDLPLSVSGWTRVAECYKTDNGYQCGTAADCTAWHNQSFCQTFRGQGGGHDLAQAIFYRVVGSSEPNSYTFNLNIDSTGHPGWAVLTALRGAATTNPVRDWAHKGCDGDNDSLFPSVYGQKGDMVLLSQSFDDAVSESTFGAPAGTKLFGYTVGSDETGYLFGGILNATGETGTLRTAGNGASSCKDALVSLTVKPK